MQDSLKQASRCNAVKGVRKRGTLERRDHSREKKRERKQRRMLIRVSILSASSKRSALRMEGKEKRDSFQGKTIESGRRRRETFSERWYGRGVGCGVGGVVGANRKLKNTWAKSLQQRGGPLGGGYEHRMPNKIPVREGAAARLEKRHLFELD